MLNWNLPSGCHNFGSYPNITQNAPYIPAFIEFHCTALQKSLSTHKIWWFPNERPYWLWAKNYWTSIGNPLGSHTKPDFIELSCLVQQKWPFTSTSEIYNLLAIWNPIKQLLEVYQYPLHYRLGANFNKFHRSMSQKLRAHIFTQKCKICRVLSALDLH